MATLTERPAGRGTRALRNAWKVYAATIVLVVLAMGGYQRVHAALDHRAQRDVVRTAQLAGEETGRTIPTVPPDVVASWNADGIPTRAQVAPYLGDGNDLLAAAYYRLSIWHSHVRGDDDSTGCVYLAVQPGGGSLDSRRVSALVAACYDPDGQPRGWGQTAVGR